MRSYHKALQSTLESGKEWTQLVWVQVSYLTPPSYLHCTPLVNNTNNKLRMQKREKSCKWNENDNTGDNWCKWGKAHRGERQLLDRLLAGECVHSFLYRTLSHILTAMPFFIQFGSYNTPFYVNQLCSNNEPYLCTLNGHRAILQPHTLKL
jgi:hypothetical protein